MNGERHKEVEKVEESKDVAEMNEDIGVQVELWNKIAERKCLF